VFSSPRTDVMLQESRDIQQTFTMTLCELLDIDLPLIQAPMAGFQGGDMASAVSNAGALGSLPCATLSAGSMRAELAAIRGKTSRPVNVNFFCHASPPANPEREAAWRLLLSPYFKEYGIVPPESAGGALRKPFDTEAADALESFRPAVVSFHFGLPSPNLLARVKSWGSKVLSSATTVAEARWLEVHGVDAIIAQGEEAGGHRGMFLSDDITTQVGTFALLPQICEAVGLPVIAAGGIADAQGVAAAMSLGAAGVQVGTAYLLCPEATTSVPHRAALKSPIAAHTALTNLFSGGPARGIVNRLMRELGPINAAAPAFPLASSALAPLRAKAESVGIGDFSPLWSGQNASGCREIPAAILTQTLTQMLARTR
jgi:nitronate monooxygenase